MANSLFVPFNPNGRTPKYTAKKLLEEFENYLEDRKARTIDVKEIDEGFTGNSGFHKESLKSIAHPISIADFCIYLGVARSWWNHDAENAEGISLVKEKIKTYIENFQLKGASVGIFNANIVARQLGLADRQQVEGKVDYNFKFGE